MPPAPQRQQHPVRLGLPPTDNSSQQGNYILKRGAGQLWKPAYDGTNTVIRIYPGLNPEDPSQFDPWRFSTQEDSYGQWFYWATCVERIGNPGKSWILADPQDETYDEQANPVWMLRTAIDQAIAKREDRGGWAGLLKGSPGKGAMLPKPRACTFVQCAIMKFKQTVYETPRGGGSDDDTVFMLLTPSAKDAIFAAMNQRVEGFRGDPEDIAGHYVNGDPISLDAGCFVHIFKIGCDPRNVGSANSRSTFGGATQRKPGGSGDDIGYEAFIEPEFNKIPANADGIEEAARRHAKNFRDSLLFPDVLQQIRWLEQCFHAEPDILVYALDERYGRDLTPDVRNAGLRRLGRGTPTRGGWQGNQQVEGSSQEEATQEENPHRGGFGGSTRQGRQASSEAVHTPVQQPTQKKGGFGGSTTQQKKPLTQEENEALGGSEEEAPVQEAQEEATEAATEAAPVTSTPAPATTPAGVQQALAQARERALANRAATKK